MQRKILLSTRIYLEKIEQKSQKETLLNKKATKMLDNKLHSDEVIEGLTNKNKVKN